MRIHADPDPQPCCKAKDLAPFKAVLRIRIYYYTDPDPVSKKCPYESGS